MRVRVTRPFRDKHTRETYEKDQVITLTKKRFEEINGTPNGVLVDPIEEPKKPKKSSKKK